MNCWEYLAGMGLGALDFKVKSEFFLFTVVEGCFFFILVSVTKVEIRKFIS